MKLLLLFGLLGWTTLCLADSQSDDPILRQAEHVESAGSFTALCGTVEAKQQEFCVRDSQCGTWLEYDHGEDEHVAEWEWTDQCPIALRIYLGRNRIVPTNTVTTMTKVPLKSGDQTLANIPAGKDLVVLAVSDALSIGLGTDKVDFHKRQTNNFWVKVSYDVNGKPVTGWILSQYLDRLLY